MIRDDASLLLDIENAYDSIRLNMDCLTHLSMNLSTEPDKKGAHSIFHHLIYLCEKDTAVALADIEAAIGTLKQKL